MTRLLDLPDALRDQGVEPVIVDGFATRGIAFEGNPRIHLFHWTAGPATGVTPSLRTVTYGRGEPNPLPGPLCQVLQSREGGTKPDKAYCVASGQANHAGVGVWSGVTSGNRNGTGNEIEWSGPGEVFPQNRYETTVRIGAAFQSLNPNPDGKWCCNHREYATPIGRKIDTNLDGNRLRLAVNSRLTGDDMYEDADRAMLKAIALQVARMNQSLVPRQPQNVITDNRNGEIGKQVPVGTPLSEPASDLWRWDLQMELERQKGFPKLVENVAAAVVAALPPAAGGSAPTLAEIQSVVEVAVRGEIDKQLGFLKPDQ